MLKLKNIMKKLLTLGLIGIIGISAIACDSGGDSESETSQEASESSQEAAENLVEEGTSEEVASESTDEEVAETVTLKIAARGGSHVDAINAVKEEFENEHNVVIEVSGYENPDLKTNIMLDSTKSVSDFDLVMLDDPWMPEITEASILLNLTEQGVEADSDFIEAGVKLGQDPYAEGDLYALPYSGNIMMYFYNTDLVADAPSSWAEVLEDAKTVSADSKFGYVIRGQQGNPIVSDWLPIFWANGGEVFNENWTASVNTPEAIEALELYMELLENGANYEKNDLVAAVSDGNGAASLGWPSWYVTSEGASAAYATIPGKFTADGEEYPAGMIGNWMIGVMANTDQPELATQLVEFLTSAESQIEGAKVGGVPTRTSVLNNEEVVAANPHFPILAESMENAKARPRTALWGACEEALGAELSAAISGVKTASEALDDAAEALDTIIQGG